MNDRKLLIIPLLLLAASLLLLVEQGGVLWQSVAAGKYCDRLTVATVRGEDLTINNPERDRGLPPELRDSRSPAEIKESALHQELLFREACSQGFRADGQEVDGYIAEVREGLAADPELYAYHLEELEWLGLSEDEYWEAVRPVYEKLLTNGVFYRRLEAEYWKAHQQAGGESCFEDYYQDVYLPELFRKYDVILK